MKKFKERFFKIMDPTMSAVAKVTAILLAIRTIFLIIDGCSFEQAVIYFGMCLFLLSVKFDSLDDDDEEEEVE